MVYFIPSKPLRFSMTFGERLNIVENIKIQIDFKQICLKINIKQSQYLKL